MKKNTLMMLVLFLLGVFLFSAPVSAIPIPLGLDPDCIIGAGCKEDLGGNSNPISEYNWLNGLEGVELPAYGVGGIGIIKFEDPTITSQDSNIIFAFGGLWNYAAVKAGQTWYAVSNCEYDDYLVLPASVFSSGISHISFVPEPGTMLLLGFGLVGLAMSGQKRLLKGA